MEDEIRIVQNVRKGLWSQECVEEDENQSTRFTFARGRAVAGAVGVAHRVMSVEGELFCNLTFSPENWREIDKSINGSLFARSSCFTFLLEKASRGDLRGGHLVT